MAAAYAVVLVTAEMYDRYRRDAVAKAQEEADKKFEALAQERRLPLVTRNPEPRVMTHEEMTNFFPGAYLHGLVGLFFTADIT